MSVSHRVLPLIATLALAACNEATSPSLLPTSGLALARFPGQSLGSSTISASEISLNWVDDSRNENGWEVYRSATGPTGAYTLLASLNANVTGYSNTSLSALTEYCYRVRWFRNLGKNRSYGEFSNTACSTTYGPPPAPTGLTAIPRNSQSVALAWTDNATNENGYRVDRSADGVSGWTAAATLSVNANSTTIALSTGGVEARVCFRAVAVGTYGESASNVACTTPPLAPANLTAVAGTGTSIDVTWTDHSGIEDGYQLERAGADYGFTVIATLPPNATSYHDAGVVSDEPYYYRVRATAGAGVSDYAGPVQGVAVSGPPRAPGIDATPGGSSAIYVYVSIASVSTTSVRVERSADGVSGWTTAGTTDPFSGFSDTNREPEVLMCYRAFAANAFGESPASNVDCSRPLARPTNLQSTTDEFGDNVTTWKDNSAYEEYYIVNTVYCDPQYGCWDYGSYWLDANTESIVTYSLEYVSSVYACGDGGCSDEGVWGNAAQSSIANAQVRAALTRVRTRALTGQARVDWLKERVRRARRR